MTTMTSLISSGRMTMTTLISRRAAALCGASGRTDLLLKKRWIHSTRNLLKSLNGATAPLSQQPPPSSSSTTADNEDGGSIQGEILDLAVDLRSVRPGDKLEIPYELTVTESFHDFWQSAFHSQDRIHTSRPFARRMGLQDKVLPFPLALFLTSSMTHADAAKVQVGFGQVHYLWPAFAGDTFTKSFQVQSVRNTSDGNHSIIHFTCDLINHRGRVCMRADKRLLFEFPLAQSSLSSSHSPTTAPHLFRDHLLSKASVLGDELGSHSLVPLRAGQLILHTLHRTLTQSQSQQLASLARLTHERHFDTRKYDVGSEILIPGGLVLGLAMSASSRDLHEVLFEELSHVQYVNSLHPNNLVGAVSYISSVDENIPGDLESLTVRTIGIKNVDVRRDLHGVPLPLELFTGQLTKPKELEHICKTKCPKLSNKIVVQMDRKIIRQSPHQEIFLL